MTVDEALAQFPSTVAERLDRTLLNLAAWSTKPGATLSLTPTDYPIAFAEDAEVINFVVEQLAEAKYLSNRARNVVVTAAGWNRVADLQRSAAGRNPLQAFVAMWFDPAGRESREAGLKNGITAAGYDPRIIDRTEFLGKVDDRIIAEIRKSRFVVADLTGQRQNVYFEAGFAEGLGLPVIYTCHESDFKNCHFDKRQENFIVWTTAEGLAERLQLRIEATLGRPSGNRATYA